MDRTTETIQTYNKIATEYAQNIATLSVEEEVEKLTTFLKPPGLVLDLGCAAGRDSKILKDLGFDTIGVDLSEKLLEIAKKNNPSIPFVEADIRKLPFPDNYFDGLWANAVFHHLTKTEMPETLREWYRILKKDGIMFIKTKMGQGVWQGEDKLSAKETREFTLISIEEMENMLKTSGLEILGLHSVKDPAGRDILWLQAFCKK